MLENLKDIHLPEAISWWPPAIGWWLTALLLVLLLAYAIHYVRKPSMKRQALSILKRIEKEFKETHDASKCLKELSVLLRRVAITQRIDFAGLTGAAWLEYLDQGVKSGEFSQGVGKILLTGPYRYKVEEAEVPDLVRLCRKWVEAK